MHTFQAILDRPIIAPMPQSISIKRVQMSVDQENQTQVAWGEGPSYAGPGNQWTSHSIDD